MSVLVTGVTGFVGSALATRLVSEGRHVRGATRSESRALTPGVEPAILPDVSSATDWRAALREVDTVVHLAARVHIMRDSARNPLAEFRRTNVDGTVNLARHAAAAFVRRFVYLSSVKVNGESGLYTETDVPAPRDAYGMSKFEAEQELGRIAGETRLEVVIVRPPLVYGPGVRANFRALVHTIARGLPLPFKSVNNRRSLVALENLVDFIVTCVDHPAAANETFFVSDGLDLSTPDLVRRVANALGRPARLVSFPPSLLVAGATLIGKGNYVRRLVGSLQVDISKARRLLDWQPRVTVDDALRNTVASLL